MMNDDLGKMWKEAVVVYFKILFQNLSGGLRKATKIEPAVYGIRRRITVIIIFILISSSVTK
jgi:hypothetical protein